MRRLILLFTLVALLVPSQRPAAEPNASGVRRVNVPYFSDAIDESQAAIFWFGQNEWYQNIPSRNYIDVRIAYSPAGLYWRATGIDYYLWYQDNPQPSDDLTHYDALALYLDTGHDRASAPQSDDYYFLVGLHGEGPEDTPQYRRQARGTGSGWNTTAISSTAWSDYSFLQWSDTGPNDNSGNIDYGWVMGGTIPWSAVGLSGPPAAGTVWGLGMLQYDQDQSLSSSTIQENWPEAFNRSQPGTWGELHFGNATYQPPSAVKEGTTIIRAATPVDNTVEDAWMGGGGACSGGHNGGSEVNHGNDTALFVGSEIQPTHFPCFNKSYLRFALDSLPAGKVIMSATLTLHQWGGASYDPFYTISYVWLSSATDAWDEMTIHWNNAPLAHENLSMTPIPPKTTPLVWPGDPYTWDATKAVAEAYAAGQPVSFAMYDSTTGRDSSKYLTASETGIDDDPWNWNWDIEGRPKLTVVWGKAAATINKDVWPLTPATGQRVTYTLSLLGSGQALTLTDNLPAQVSPPGPIQVTGGPAATYSAPTHRLTWNGSPASSQPVTITFPVTVTVPMTSHLAVSNTAVMTDAVGNVSTDGALFLVNAYQMRLPIVLRR